MTPLHIRIANVDDAAAINAIYNHYVERSTCTYDLQPHTDAERRRSLTDRAPVHPVTVAALSEGGPVVGWASLSPFRNRPAYQWTVENAVYVHPKRQRQGIGRALLSDILERGRVIGHHSVIAVIDAEQRGSIALHEAAGFVHCGLLREAGFKFDRWLDVVLMQKRW